MFTEEQIGERYDSLEYRRFKRDLLAPLLDRNLPLPIRNAAGHCIIHAPRFDEGIHLALHAVLLG